MGGFYGGGKLGNVSFGGNEDGDFTASIEADFKGASLTGTVSGDFTTGEITAIASVGWASAHVL